MRQWLTRIIYGSAEYQREQEANEIALVLDQYTNLNYYTHDVLLKTARSPLHPELSKVFGFTNGKHKLFNENIGLAVDAIKAGKTDQIPIPLGKAWQLTEEAKRHFDIFGANAAAIAAPNSSFYSTYLFNRGNMVTTIEGIMRGIEGLTGETNDQFLKNLEGALALPYKEAVIFLLQGVNDGFTGISNKIKRAEEKYLSLGAVLVKSTGGGRF